MCVKTAIGIEAHSNRYFYDNNTVQFVNLLGGYLDKDMFVPVRIGIKQNQSGKGAMYILISDEAIKKDKVVNVGRRLEAAGHTSRLSYICIAKLAKLVNNKDIKPPLSVFFTFFKKNKSFSR